MSAPAIHTPQLPRNFERIRQRAEAFYAARNGMTGMTLNDWLKAEQELKHSLAKTNRNTGAAQFLAVSLTPGFSPVVREPGRPKPFQRLKQRGAWRRCGKRLKPFQFHRARPTPG